MRIYNSLSRQVEEFVPLFAPKIGMYTCGPTVYRYAHIGNFRTYILGDLLLRVMRANGYDINYVMNITDVGHLTGDNLGDADAGDDRMEEAAKKERRSAYDVAKFYTQQFLADFDRLNLIRPTVMPKATEHISEQITLIQKLETNGFVYRTSDGMYFDTAKWPRYGELSTLGEIQAGARVEVNRQKKNPKDFALWKFSIFPHHEDEIAQSEGRTGKPFVKYWVHGAFLLVDGGRMSKSLGNNYAVTDLAEKGFSPMGLRYLYLTVHYRSQQNFTWSALAAAETAWDKLNGFVQEVKSKKQEARSQLSREKLRKLDGYRKRFEQAINDDLQFPQGLAVMWEMLKSNIPDYDKADTLLDWDQILGLKLGISDEVPVPQEVREMAAQREELRRKGKFVEADEVRVKMEKLGWKVEDTIIGAKIKKLIGRG
ncbi:MAG: Cysteine-tRNA ligase [Candidatus Amesbacteria bacterium GW2011_GWC1_48_10]|uniref:Cysteine-tRNA ligase n=1 Tax=Candidatus Amesbacteria bacterium GW2011_GWC1_48_10 TaxID=1618365 RepID=A0A0G1UFH1_9BACT|nr:MAG: Cysteine-tRNA ligase [Candidatus Amesbacteria bacterium GW2011_GWC1_48_10]